MNLLQQAGPDPDSRLGQALTIPKRLSLQGFTKKHPNFVGVHYVGFRETFGDGKSEEGKMRALFLGREKARLCNIGLCTGEPFLWKLSTNSSKEELLNTFVSS